MAERSSRRAPDPLEALDFDVFLACYLYGWRLEDVENMPLARLRRAVRFGIRFRAIDSLNAIRAGIAADPWYGAQDRARLEREFIDAASGEFLTDQQRADEGWKNLRRMRGLA